MNKTMVVIKREYITRVKKKSFIILTLLVPLLFGLITTLPAIFMRMSSSTDEILVIDNSGFKTPISLKNTSTMHFTYKSIDKFEEYKKNFAKDGYAGLLLIPKINIDRPLGIRFYSKSQAGVKITKYVKEKLKRVIEKERFEKYGYNLEEINKLWVDLDIENVILTKEGEKSGNTLIAIILSQVLGGILYFALFSYGSMIMRGVIEEKKNRIIEVMISSIKPFQLMMGKIIGIGCVALTQLLIWGILLSVILTVAGSFINPSTAANMPSSKLTEISDVVMALQNLNYGIILPSFFIFFIFGYFMYSAMFAAVGSAAGEQQENQSISLVVTAPVIISFILMTNIVNEPHSPLAFWSSIFPLFSPIVMTARLPFGVPIWQIALSITLLIISFGVVTWLSARIYRIGILMYGKKVTLKEFFKWMLVKD